ncbi:hypothetical protein K501DRAFT_334402 [Backusella circina FSU 941]|nr:hypothetical protein K501DRAFT_334402 [Backusella circina FSU 941]
MSNIIIPNLHPSHRYSDNHQDDEVDVEEVLSTSLHSRVESFIGSYSRTSLVHMAENVVVGNEGMEIDDDALSTTSSNLPRYTKSICSSRRNSLGTLNEETPLFPKLQAVTTCNSVLTVADNYPVDVIYSKSSFLQSVFNSINILIGVGILSLPLAFKYTGWVVGMAIFIFCFLLTNYTAKLLAKCLDVNSESRTYGDLSAAAYGRKGRVFVSFVFLTELITCSVALVVLLSDGIDSLFPGHDPLLVKIISFAILTPTLFIPVRHLSYTSLMGILSMFSLLFVILYDGLTKVDAPGSMIQPASTDVLPSDWKAVPMSFGLIMAGFAGHAVFPTIYRDMKNPKEYTKMVNYTYLVTAIVYFTIAAAGYAMFGPNTMQEITQNLVTIPEYSQTLNRLAVWLIALNPIAKYGLTLNPVLLSWQIEIQNSHRFEEWFAKAEWRRTFVNSIGIVLTSLFIVYLAMLIPNFDSIMSVLGALFSFFISGIFPILCHLKLYGSKVGLVEKTFSIVLVVIAGAMAFSGTLFNFI